MQNSHIHGQPSLYFLNVEISATNRYVALRVALGSRTLFHPFILTMSPTTVQHVPLHFVSSIVIILRARSRYPIFPFPFSRVNIAYHPSPSFPFLPASSIFPLSSGVRASTYCSPDTHAPVETSREEAMNFRMDFLFRNLVRMKKKKKKESLRNLLKHALRNRRHIHTYSLVY